MEQVAGGNWQNSHLLYKSKDTPRYQVGQTVQGRFYIQAINAEKGGVINKEFTYVVVDAADHSKVLDREMFESELLIEEGFWKGNPFRTAD